MSSSRGHPRQRARQCQLSKLDEEDPPEGSHAECVRRRRHRSAASVLARPELMPPTDACDAERTLHASLLADPLRPVSKADIAALADADARENWTFMMSFRDHLLAAPSLEAM